MSALDRFSDVVEAAPQVFFTYLERLGILTIVCYGWRQLQSYELLAIYAVGMGLLMMWIYSMVIIAARWFTSGNSERTPRLNLAAKFNAGLFTVAATLGSLAMSMFIVEALIAQQTGVHT